MSSQFPVPELKNPQPEHEVISDTTNSLPPNIQDKETEAQIAEKEESIRQACNLRDFDALVAHATSKGGFLRDDIRRLACKSLYM